MTKEDTGGLFKAMGRLVRNPLKEAGPSEVQDSRTEEEDREALRAVIRQRQRNDYVRRREFDMLRQLRQREIVDESSDSTLLYSSSPTLGKEARRAQTIRKIDEIEAQMSQQWWKGRTPAPGPATTVQPDSMLIDSEQPDSVQFDSVHADSVQPVHPVQPVQPDPMLPAAAAPPGEAFYPDAARQAQASCIDEAAARFAAGQAAAAEALLMRQIASAGQPQEAQEVWLALLDLYRAQGEAEKFNITAGHYRQHFKDADPEWVSLPARALFLGADRVDGMTARISAQSIDWHCPERLTRESLGELAQCLERAGPVWKLDWHWLQSIEPDAAAALCALFMHWGDSPVQLCFCGTEYLLAVLERATPMGRRETDPLWWQLRMAALRATHQIDAFELAALSHCVTYEAVPPSWTDPRCGFTALKTSVPGEPVLAGELRGDIRMVLRRLDMELAAAERPVIGCAALVCVDHAAARLLLAWASAHAANGQRVEFHGVHRLVDAFFRRIGIGAQAQVVVRGA